MHFSRLQPVDGPFSQESMRTPSFFDFRPRRVRLY